jgi:hypothetical protein
MVTRKLTKHNVSKFIHATQRRREDVLRNVSKLEEHRSVLVKLLLLNWLVIRNIARKFTFVIRVRTEDVNRFV